MHGDTAANPLDAASGMAKCGKMKTYTAEDFKKWGAQGGEKSKCCACGKATPGVKCDDCAEFVE